MQNTNSRNPSTCAIKEGSNIIFYINLSGFPLAPDAMSQMWEYAKDLQPNAADKLNDLRDEENLPDAPILVVPYAFIYNKKLSNYERVSKIQKYIDELSYNHTGLQFFDIRKDRPLVGLVDVAKKIIEDSLPIKCLEAVILSIYLTNEIGFSNNIYLTNNLEKFTIGFKTSSQHNIHRHVVLGIYCHVTGQYGALGISRRSDLAYKPLSYATLTELLLDFIETYGVYLHKVKRIKIGMPVPCSNRSFESIPWNGCTMNTAKTSVPEWSKMCEKHARIIRQTGMVTGVNPAQVQAVSLRTVATSSTKRLTSRLNKSQETTKQPKILLKDNDDAESSCSIENKIASDVCGGEASTARPATLPSLVSKNPSALATDKELRASICSTLTNDSTTQEARTHSKVKSLRV